MKGLLAAMLLSVAVAPAVVDAACLAHPLNGAGRITSVPSMRMHPTLKVQRWHKGLDIAMPTGSPVVAAEAGVVRAAFQSPGAGIYVAITGSQYQTKYFHLSKRAEGITQGSRVAAGQLIGHVGMTGGISTGPHLHFEVWQGGDFKRQVLPLLCSGGAAPPPQGGDDVHGHGPGVSETEADGSGPSPSGPDMSSWDDISTRELIAGEIDRRFLNPQWLEQQATMSKHSLLMEYNHMMALRLYMRERQRRQRERIEMLTAARMARENQAETSVRLDRQREAAAKAQ